MGSRLIICIVALACATQAGAGSFYRWVDSRGNVHYSDVPPPAASKVERRTVGGNVIETSVPDYALQLAMKNFPVSLYTSPTCGDACEQARDVLRKRGVPFKEIAVKSPEAADELKKASGGDQVPVLLVGKDVQRGFEATAFKASLDAAGYPVAQTLGRRAGKPSADARSSHQAPAAGPTTPPDQR